MGGGAGVSIPGTFRIASGRTVFATPETLIGFHPDAGASFYLSHLPGHLGEYLALTGEKLNPAEMMACGLATHYSLSERLPLIEEALGKLVTDDPSVIEACLEKYCDIVHPDQMSVVHRIEILDKCFSLDTVEEIIDSLEREAAETNDAWCSSTLRRLKEASPLSLKVSLRSVRYEKVDLRPLIKAWSVNTECHYKGYLSKFLVIFVREFVHEWWRRTLPQSGVLQVWNRCRKIWLIAIFPHLVNLSLI
ncbi:3-hydroxyisobutyryl-CoA hydrolase-like protein 1, mitochondrial isoform X2 [Pistacia vera]|uniref:3-hydroxyisobutyryl-CoA hydrolase-like protein 1, mitochondrial isoform X2 n=1 Tax=Pistacia vera TaxID=55513 RepID=UPI0012632576|nr:3-hydroxyisobutyryl-CoA hydrolase-like protein 1, mitochondrial isoform X2 [Pistacia vera]